MAKIIVQNEDDDTLFTVKVLLEQEGHIVYSYLHCSEISFETIDNILPELIILDYSLNGTDCCIFCPQLKIKYPNIPVIVLSTNNSITSIYHQLGFDAYILEPFDLHDFFIIIDSYIR